MACVALRVAVLLLHLMVATFATAQSCNTNSNPYCRGNAKLAALCCPYPNVCYWSNRNGQPACCPAGQDCSANGGPGPNYTPSPSTYFFGLLTSSTQYFTTYTLYSTSTYTPTPQFSTVTTAAVVVVTATQTYYPPTTSAAGGAYSTVTSAVVGAYTTITSAVGGVFTTFTQAVAGNEAIQSCSASAGLLFAAFSTVISIMFGAFLL